MPVCMIFRYDGRERVLIARDAVDIRLRCLSFMSRSRSSVGTILTQDGALVGYIRFVVKKTGTVTTKTYTYTSVLGNRRRLDPATGRLGEEL